MKKFYFSLFLIGVTFSAVFSQVPNAFNYQAVVRSTSGEIISNQSVSFKISILEDSESGTVLYSETHTLSTNAFGLANFEIGHGENTTGTFTPVGWGTAPHFVKVEIDPAGGSTFSHLVTSKLASVPYAFHAQTVAYDQVDDADADATNELQVLSLNGTLLELSNGGGSVTLPTSGDSSGDNWGAQKVVSNASLTGDGTSASPLAVVADGDSNDSNELQTLSLSGSNLSLSDGGGTVALPASPWSESTNEIYYNGTKSVNIGIYAGSSARTKSTQIADPAKLEISTGNTPAIEVYSESSVYSAVDIWNEEGIAARFGGNSDKAVAIFDNADVGLAAQFKDKIQIEDGTQGAGKVLTSDASGNASWQEPASGGSSAWTTSGSDVYRASGKVGIGIVPTGSIKLDVKTDESWIAIKGENNSPTYGAIYLKNNGTGPAADLRSPIKIMDGTEGDGKVLTSDASGNASWQNGLWIENTVGYNSYYTMENISIGAAHASTPVGLFVDGDDKYAAVVVNESSSPALYVDNHGTGLAAQFKADINIEGEIHTENTGSANMIAIAYGTIKSDGSVLAGSGNISVSKITGKYTITITGESYIYYNYITTATLSSTGFIETGSVSGKLLVFTSDTSGDLSDIGFSFVVYKP